MDKKVKCPRCRKWVERLYPVDTEYSFEDMCEECEKVVYKNILFNKNT